MLEPRIRHQIGFYTTNVLLRTLVDIKQVNSSTRSLLGKDRLDGCYRLQEIERQIRTAIFALPVSPKLHQSKTIYAKFKKSKNKLRNSKLFPACFFSHSALPFHMSHNYLAKVMLSNKVLEFGNAFSARTKLFISTLTPTSLFHPEMENIPSQPHPSNTSPQSPYCSPQSQYQYTLLHQVQLHS
jgi:hypothetical protein